MWRVAKSSANGWLCVWGWPHGEKPWVSFQPTQFGRLESLGYHGCYVSYIAVKNTVLDVRLDFGDRLEIRRFGHRFSDERRRLCEAIVQHLNELGRFPMIEPQEA